MYEEKILPYLRASNSGCIHWTKAKRAYVYVDREHQVQVKRYLYEREFGPIPPYAKVLRDSRVCGDDSCVNARHKRVITEDQRLLNKLDRRHHALLYAPGTSPEARAKRRRGYARMMRDFHAMRAADRSDQPTPRPSQAECILSMIRGSSF